MSAHPCRYCRKPLRQAYPQLRYELQWAHVSKIDAAECPSLKIRTRTSGWPVPLEEGQLPCACPSIIRDEAGRLQCLTHGDVTDRREPEPVTGKWWRQEP